MNGFISSTRGVVDFACGVLGDLSGQLGKVLVKKHACYFGVLFGNGISWLCIVLCTSSPETLVLYSSGKTFALYLIIYKLI